MATELKTKIDEGYTEFGGPISRQVSKLRPTGLIGRFFAKFMPSKGQLATVQALDDGGNPAPIHPLAGDTVINTDVITLPELEQSNHVILPELERARKDRYREYEGMDEYPEIGSAFDIFADEACQETLEKQKWDIETSDPLVREEIKNLFDTIDLEYFIWDIVRNTAKYGDCFVEIILDLDKPNAGLQRIKILNPSYIIRVENEYGYLIAFLQEIPEKADWDSYGMQGYGMRGKNYIHLDKNQIVHFRLHTSDPSFYPYGRSIAALASKTWRSLKLMEDAMLIYRLERAPEKLAFYIDVGQLPATKAEMFIERIKQKFKKEKYYDPIKGAINERYNPLCLVGDTRIPLINGEIKTLKELAESGEEIIEVWASDGKKIVPAKASRPFISGKNAKILEITLDNGESIRCTPEHKFLLRNGEYAEAKDLKVNDSLFPFYARVRNGYLQIQEIPGGKWKHAHKMVGEHYYGIKEYKGKHIHHKDKVKSNNSVDNLILLWPAEHAKIHFGDSWHSVVSKYKSKKTRSTKEYKKLRSKISKEWWKNNEPTEKQRKHWKALGKLSKTKESKERSRLRMVEINKTKKRFGKDGPNYKGAKIEKECPYCKDIFKSFRSQNRKYCSYGCSANAKVTSGKYATKYYNHKVISITSIGVEKEVYDLTVPVYHNFALEAGIVVHNSFSENFYIPMRGGQGTKIDTIPGAQNLGEVDDVKYFRDKLLAAMKIPKDYVVEKENSPDRKANLSQLDVKFARVIMRIQKNVELGLESIAKRHLKLKQYPQSAIDDLKIRLPEPSDVFVKRKLEIEEQKVRVIQGWVGLKILPMRKIYKEFFNMNDLEIDELEEELKEDLQKEVEKQSMLALADPTGFGEPPPGGDNNTEVIANKQPGSEGIESAENKSPTEKAREAINTLEILHNKILNEEGNSDRLKQIRQVIIRRKAQLSQITENKQ